MVVTFKFLGGFRNMSRKSKIALKFESPVSLREAVEKIINEFPALQKALIDPELGDVRPNSLIIVNGKEISVLNGLETVLKDGDEVVFVPVLHGG
ncbi:MAG: MoaD/ThiS family protein [Nitrososphaerota archaeon]|nr:MoaD/ThiS family protein [Candidatus Bathyarchaeota archaeon]MDW8023241.1 MoaD/ThiS family protein [Nitrososphaerota archaeon]